VSIVYIKRVGSNSRSSLENKVTFPAIIISSALPNLKIRLYFILRIPTILSILRAKQIEASP
jgi:hypothetical protein